MAEIANSFDELLDSVNSMLEEGECTPTELHPPDLKDFDELYDSNEGDDENSDIEITGSVELMIKHCMTTFCLLCCMQMK